MFAILLANPVHVFPLWVLYLFTAVALLAAGIGPLSEWLLTKRFARAILLALSGAAIFVLIIVDCWGLPDWLCYLIP